MSRVDTVDVAVIGGGPAGAAAAVALRAAGASVAVVAGPGPRTRTRSAPGQSAPPGTDRVVRDLFGADGFDDHAHVRSLGNRAAWGDDDLVLTDFMFNPFGTGWHLDRAAFDARLRACARERGAAVLDTTSFVGAAHARRSVDARSRRWPPPRRRRGVRRVGPPRRRRPRHGGRVVHTDRLVAVACNATRSIGDDDHTSTVEAVADGWWYTAPCPDGTRAFLHVTEPDLLDRACTTRAGFAERVAATRHVAERFSSCTYPTAPFVVPAGTARLVPPTGPGWVAAGDAAATFDPLSSQGILCALLSGRDAAISLLDPTFDYRARWTRVVRDYERERADWYAAEPRFPASVFWTRRLARRAA